MEQHFTETLLLAREQANRQVENPRERAIIIRDIENAYCRALGAGQLPLLPALPGRASPPG